MTCIPAIFRVLPALFLGLFGPTRAFSGGLEPAKQPGTCIVTCSRDQLTAEQCTQRCGGPGPMAPLGPLGPMGPADAGQGRANETGGTTALTRIVNTGTQAYYGGVIQISAGITQVSRSAQNRTEKGAANKTELVRGLLNIRSGTEAVQESGHVIDYANSLSAHEARGNSVGSVSSAAKYSLAFDPAKAGSIGKDVLREMEKVAGISAESLASAVKDPTNVYDLAAGARGMALSGDELKQVAEAALAKAGKPTNPEVAPGVTMNDLLKDLDMFLSKKGELAAAAASPEAKAPPPAAESAPTTVQETGTVQKKAEKAAEKSERPLRELAGLTDEPLPNIRAEMMAGDEPDVSLFQRVRRQYGKRRPELRLTRTAP